MYWINADSYRIEKMSNWMDIGRKANPPYYTYSNYGKIGGVTRSLVNLRHAPDAPREDGSGRSWRSTADFPHLCSDGPKGRLRFSKEPS